MRTPDGRDCKFFYGDYYRGRDFEECRALSSAADKSEWTSKLCRKCQMPVILKNNACPNMVLGAGIKKNLMGTRIKIVAYCSKVHDDVKDPNIGCGYCHTLVDLPQ